MAIFFNFCKMCSNYNIYALYRFRTLPGALKAHFRPYITFPATSGQYWKNRKNRPCPDCKKMLTYSRKDAFDRAVGNNSVCKSCAQTDRKVTLETIEKMKQPKTIQHKKKISKSIQWR